MTIETKQKSIEDLALIEIPLKYRTVVRELVEFLKEGEHINNYEGNNMRYCHTLKLLKSFSKKDELAIDKNILYPYTKSESGILLKKSIIESWFKNNEFDFIYSRGELHNFLNLMNYKRIKDNGRIPLGYIYQWHLFDRNYWEDRKIYILEKYGKTRYEAQARLIKKLNEYIKEHRH